MSSWTAEGSLAATVRLAEAAVAAGACGHPLSLCFVNFPAADRASLWRRFVETLATEEVVHVGQSGDLQKVAGGIEQARLILVHEPKFHVAVAREVYFGRRAGQVASPRPSLFTAGPVSNMDEDPGATLSVQSTPDSLSGLHAWLRKNEALAVARLSPTCSFQFETGLERLLWPPLPDAGVSGKLSLRECEALRGILVGACVLRNGVARTEGAVNVVTLRQDYAAARRMLQSCGVSGADDSLYPLVAPMVRRANLYLRFRAGVQMPDRPARSDTVEETARASGTRGVTRRELVDLGDLRSQALKDVVELVLREANAKEEFAALGTVHEVSDADWGTREVKRLTAFLLPWSEKQVRTNFERLVRDGLVTAEIRARNQPYFYLIPERLTRGSAFAFLPEAEILAQRLAGSGVRLPCLPSVCPTAGQPEKQ